MKQQLHLFTRKCFGFCVCPIEMCTLCALLRLFGITCFIWQMTQGYKTSGTSFTHDFCFSGNSVSDGRATRRATNYGVHICSLTPDSCSSGNSSEDGQTTHMATSCGGRYRRETNRTGSLSRMLTKVLGVMELCALSRSAHVFMRCT